LNTSTGSKDKVILVELTEMPGTQEVSLSSHDMVERSAEAFDNAMETLKQTAQRTVSAIDELRVRPSQVELKFGIKIDAEANAWITKVHGEGNIQVSLTWQK
jgi:hypothetical protein